VLSVPHHHGFAGANRFHAAHMAATAGAKARFGGAWRFDAQKSADRASPEMNFKRYLESAGCTRP
jgi:hypothetical protein